jgi:hypothetical protein
MGILRQWSAIARNSSKTIKCRYFRRSVSWGMKECFRRNILVTSLLFEGELRKLCIFVVTKLEHKHTCTGLPKCSQNLSLFSDALIGKVSVYGVDDLGSIQSPHSGIRAYLTRIEIALFFLVEMSCIQNLGVRCLLENGHL